jgi:hypothetical protein
MLAILVSSVPHQARPASAIAAATATAACALRLWSAMEPFGLAPPGGVRGSGWAGPPSVAQRPGSASRAWPAGELALRPPRRAGVSGGERAIGEAAPPRLG